MANQRFTHNGTTYEYERAMDIDERGAFKFSRGGYINIIKTANGREDCFSTGAWYESFEAAYAEVCAQ
jgi:hypothetical protein